MKPSTVIDRRTIRLACEHCDRDDFDGVTPAHAKRNGWQGISRWGEDDQVGVWWTHIGTCPECAEERP